MEQSDLRRFELLVKFEAMCYRIDFIGRKHFTQFGEKGGRGVPTWVN